MVRAPCCEKMGLKKGPWTPEEDKILMDYVQNNGHGNWRALPKQAGLLRCGKSCRLRWTNYLRPDIKRGNFTSEEEETILKMHEILGNRWSTIASKLPGRTDNEIKNVWHTYLKKRAKQNRATPETKQRSITIIRCDSDESMQLLQPVTSPQSQSFSDFSSGTDSCIVPIAGETNNNGTIDEQMASFDWLPEIDESFWAAAPPAESSSMVFDFSTISINEFPSAENSSMVSDFSTISNELPPADQNSCTVSDFSTANNELQLQSSSSLAETIDPPVYDYSSSNSIDDEMDFFWYNIFIRAVGGLQELPEF